MQRNEINDKLVELFSRCICEPAENWSVDDVLNFRLIMGSDKPAEEANEASAWKLGWSVYMMEKQDTFDARLIGKANLRHYHFATHCLNILQESGVLTSSGDQGTLNPVYHCPWPCAGSQADPDLDTRSIPPEYLFMFAADLNISPVSLLELFSKRADDSYGFIDCLCIFCALRYFVLRDDPQLLQTERVKYYFTNAKQLIQIPLYICFRYFIESDNYRLMMRIMTDNTDSTSRASGNLIAIYNSSRVAFSFVSDVFGIAAVITAIFEISECLHRALGSGGTTESVAISTFHQAQNGMNAAMHMRQLLGENRRDPIMLQLSTLLGAPEILSLRQLSDHDCVSFCPGGRMLPQYYLISKAAQDIGRNSYDSIKALSYASTPVKTLVDTVTRFKYTFDKMFTPLSMLFPAPFFAPSVIIDSDRSMRHILNKVNNGANQDSRLLTPAVLQMMKTSGPAKSGLMALFIPLQFAAALDASVHGLFTVQHMLIRCPLPDPMRKLSNWLVAQGPGGIDLLDAETALSAGYLIPSDMLVQLITSGVGLAQRPEYYMERFTRLLQRSGQTYYVDADADKPLLDLLASMAADPRFSVPIFCDAGVTINPQLTRMKEISCYRDSAPLLGQTVALSGIVPGSIVVTQRNIRAILAARGMAALNMQPFSRYWGQQSRAEFFPPPVITPDGNVVVLNGSDGYFLSTLRTDMTIDNAATQYGPRCNWLEVIIARKGDPVDSAYFTTQPTTPQCPIIVMQQNGEVMSTACASAFRGSIQGRNMALAQLDGVLFALLTVFRKVGNGPDRQVWLVRLVRAGPVVIGLDTGLHFDGDISPLGLAACGPSQLLMVGGRNASVITVSQGMVPSCRKLKDKLDDATALALQSVPGTYTVILTMENSSDRSYTMQLLMLDGDRLITSDPLTSRKQQISAAVADDGALYFVDDELFITSIESLAQGRLDNTRAHLSFPVTTKTTTKETSCMRGAIALVPTPLGMRIAYFSNDVYIDVPELATYT